MHTLMTALPCSLLSVLVFGLSSLSEVISRSILKIVWIGFVLVIAVSRCFNLVGYCWLGSCRWLGICEGGVSSIIVG